jgi:hypothetical protein
LIDNPSWQHFATHDESEYPELWRGVRGYWAPCLGPSGTRLHGMSGRGNWGTLTGVAPANAWVVSDGQYAASLSFSPAAQYFDVSNLNRSLEVPGRLSVVAWARPTASATSVGRELCSLYHSTSDPFVSYGIQWHSLAAPNAWSWQVATTSYNPLASAITRSLNRWYCVVGVYTGAEVQLWVDGLVDSTRAQSGAINYNNQNFSIGTWPGSFSADEQFQGQVSDVILFDRALSPNEIRLLYQIGRGGMLTPRRRRRAYFAGSGLRRRLLLTGQV